MYKIYKTKNIIEIYYTPEIYDPLTKQRYNNWKEVSQFKLANLEDIF